MSGGHFGGEKNLAKIKQKFWGPGDAPGNVEQDSKSEIKNASREENDERQTLPHLTNY